MLRPSQDESPRPARTHRIIRGIVNLDAGDSGAGSGGYISFPWPTQPNLYIAGALTIESWVGAPKGTGLSEIHLTISIA
jgi:hypothetical protein